MRGALDVTKLEKAGSRIIPADAGSTFNLSLNAFSREDHPRGCGEHKQRGKQEFPYGGSSPRMRGAQLGQRRPTLTGRIIPADAGSTTCDHVSSLLPKDHPRGCGEHPCYMYCVPGLKGSSPRMRGARSELAIRVQLHGIIPADAGSTPRSPQQSA